MNDHIFRLVSTLCIGCAGGYIALRFKVTAGALIGAMIAVSVYGGLTSLSFLPDEGRIIAQIIAGALIGIDMSRDKVIGVKNMIWPAIFIMAGMLTINGIMGALLYYTTSLDWRSALLSTTPGGIATMSMIGYEMGANTSAILIFQLARLLPAISLLPIIIPRLAGYMDKSCVQACLAATIEETFMESSKKETNLNAGSDNIKTLLITLVSATVGGILGELSGLPAAVLVFSMFFTALLKIKTNIGFISTKLKCATQILSGIFIGCNISPTVLQQLTEYILPLIGVVVGYVLMCILLGLGLHKLFRIDVTTSLFCCIPARMSDIVLISSELDADTAQVAMLQLIRTVGVISAFPAIINLLT